MLHTRLFFELIKNKDVPIAVLEGGSGSGKTISALQRIIRRSIKEQGTITSIVSETIPQLKKGAERDFFKILASENLYVPENHNKTDRIYTLGKSSVEFFSSDNMQNVLGGRRDYLFINEAIRLNYDTAYTLMRYTNRQSIIDFNPSFEFWAHTNIRPMPDVSWLHSTFHDNPYLPEMQKKLLLERAKMDENFRRVFVEGLVGNVEGLIFQNVALIDNIPEHYDWCYGLDFGFNHPTALVKLVDIDDNLYYDELLYMSNLTTYELIRHFKSLNIDRKKFIFADSSRPDLIKEIATAGFNIRSASKDVKAGIDGMKSRSIYVTKSSTNLINELRNYRYKELKDGTILDEPIKVMDDAVDACRYAFYSFEKSFKKFAPLTVSLPTIKR